MISNRYKYYVLEKMLPRRFTLVIYDSNTASYNSRHSLFGGFIRYQENHNTLKSLDKRLDTLDRAKNKTNDGFLYDCEFLSKVPSDIIADNLSGERVYYPLNMSSQTLDTMGYKQPSDLGDMLFSPKNRRLLMKKIGDITCT